MRRVPFHRPAWVALPAILLSLAPVAAGAQYRLQPGDALELVVVGLPELRQRAAIGVDGDTVLPLAGQVKVSGLTLAEARSTVAAALANRTYQTTTPDGREAAHLIS